MAPCLFYTSYWCPASFLLLQNSSTRKLRPPECRKIKRKRKNFSWKKGVFVHDNHTLPSCNRLRLLIIPAICHEKCRGESTHCPTRCRCRAEGEACTLGLDLTLPGAMTGRGEKEWVENHSFYIYSFIHSIYMRAHYVLDNVLGVISGRSAMASSYLSPFIFAPP